MAEQMFAWSGKEISLRRLVEEFQREFPVVAMATCGYTGADSVLHEIGYGEVCRGITMETDEASPCILLSCIVLYCIVLYCIVLYCIVLYSSIYIAPPQQS